MSRTDAVLQILCCKEGTEAGVLPVNLSLLLEVPASGAAPNGANNGMHVIHLIDKR